MTIIGSVTRTAVGNIASPQQGNANAGAFTARSGAINLGFFSSVGDAKQAVNGRIGGPLRWSREDMRGGIEHYVARDIPLDPLEMLGDNLLIWSEVDSNARVINGTTMKVDLIGDQSGNGYVFEQNEPELQGTLVTNAVNSYSALELSQPDAHRMAVTLRLSPPFSIIVVGNYLGTGGAVSNLLLSDGASPWRVGVNAVGQWEYDNGGRTTISAGRADATPAMLTVRQDTTWGELRVNRVSVGTNDLTPSDATQISLGRATPDLSAGPWGGRFAALLCLDTTTISLVENAERYTRKRFGTP